MRNRQGESNDSAIAPTSPVTTAPADAEEHLSDPRRWKALAVLGLIQFMLVLDVTVVNVALPRIQHDLAFSTAGLAWVVNGYLVMAGGLLLLGGRVADIFGRRRVFLLGIGLFAFASSTCGAAVDPAMLVASRFVQGVGEALAAPASLGLIALLFPNARERVKALGFWGGIAALGGTTGTVISGLVVGFASWRWIFFINLPVALFALLVVPRLVSESRMVRGSRRPDYAAAITGTFGLIAVVASLLQAATSPWGSAQVLLPLLGGLALVGLTVWLEAISASPLVPRAFFHNRTRVVTNCATLFSSGAFFCYFFLVTLFEQQVLRYSPLEGGLGYLPFGIAIGLGAGVGTALLPHLGAKRLLGAGFFCCAIGFLLTSGIGVHASYLGNLLPGMLVLGVASGLCFPAISNSSLHDVTGQDSSLASGVQSTMQQVGGALGLAFIVPLGLHHAADLIHGGVLPAVAATDGYVLALRVAAALLTIAGVFVLVCFEQAGALQRDAFEIVTATGSHPTEDVA